MTENEIEDARGASRSDAELAMTDAEANAAQNWKGMDGGHWEYTPFSYARPLVVPNA